MSILDWRTVAPDQVDPDRLALLLTRNGWIHRGGRPGLYSRWVFQDDPDLSHRLIVPLDRQRADYEDLVREVLAELATMASEYGPQVAHVLNSLIQAPGDEIKFRKLTATVRGAVPWPTGEELVISSKNALLAAAKSRVIKLPYYGNRGGRFAHRYLDAVLMGQTEIGSYVVVAYTPVEEVFYESETQIAPALMNIGGHSGREITSSLVTALEATQEAVEHFQSSASLAGFDDAVQHGVSKEFAEAIKGMIEGAEGAEVAVQWSDEQPPLDLITPDAPDLEDKQFEFSAGIYPVLERAITKLSSMTPPERVRVTGWVTVVERPKRGAPGIVRLKVLAGSEARTLRVRLTEQQFDVALEAIRAERVLSVSGRQEREGRTYWLYDAHDLVAIETEPIMMSLSVYREASPDEPPLLVPDE
jgi:hypothetical protein